MAVIKTDDQYYYAIANAIRSRNGKDTLYKPHQLAPAIYDIFDAGYQSSIKVVTHAGSTVTATCDGITRTATANSSGIATVTGCPPGTWYVTSVFGTVDGDGQLFIDENDQYVSYSLGIPIQLSSVTVTANASCTVRAKFNGSTKYSGSGSSVTLSGLYPGTWTIEATYGSEVKTTTIMVDYGVNSYSTSFAFSIYTIAVSTIAGATVTISADAQTPKSGVATNGSISFYNCAPGVWSISSVLGRGSGGGSITVSTAASPIAYSATIKVSFPTVTLSIKGVDKVDSICIDGYSGSIWGTYSGTDIMTSKSIYKFTQCPLGQWNVWTYSGGTGTYRTTITIPYTYTGSSYEVTL